MRSKTNVHFSINNSYRPTYLSSAIRSWNASLIRICHAAAVFRFCHLEDFFVTNSYVPYAACWENGGIV